MGLTLDPAAEPPAGQPWIPRPCPPLELHGDEAEGYLLNVEATEPSLFLLVRSGEEAGDAEPSDTPPQVCAISASFHEAARWVDGGATVERLPLPAGWAEVIARYARAHLKAAAAGQPLPEPAPPAPPPTAQTAPVELPDPASLSFEDDFTRYLGAQVPAALKRAAMAKLFAEPCFNRMDGLDVYIEDYNLVPNLPAEERDLLAHAQAALNPAGMAANETPPAEVQSLAIESPAPAASTHLPAEPPSLPEAAPPVAIPSAEAAGEAVPPAGTHSQT